MLKTTLLLHLAIIQAWEAMSGPGGVEMKMDICSEESLQAGEYVIMRGTYNVLKPNGTLVDQGK